MKGRRRVRSLYLAFMEGLMMVVVFVCVGYENLHYVKAVALVLVLNVNG